MWMIGHLQLHSKSSWQVCVFFWKDCIIIIITYVDDCIILGKTMADVDLFISLLQVGDKKIQLLDQGSIDKYLGLLIWDIDSNTFEMSQPFLIYCILKFLSLNEHKTKGCDTPVWKPMLNRDLNGVPWKHSWLYCGAVGMLSYLGNSARPEIQISDGCAPDWSIFGQSNAMTWGSNHANRMLPLWYLWKRHHLQSWQIERHWGLFWCWLCWWMEGCRCRQCWKFSIKNWFCYLLC